MAVFVEVPTPAAAFHNFHTPMIVVRGNCDEKRERSRHCYAAKDSNQQYADGFKVLHVFYNRRSLSDRPCRLRPDSRGSAVSITNSPSLGFATANPCSAELKMTDRSHVFHAARRAVSTALHFYQIASELFVSIACHADLSRRSLVRRWKSANADGNMSRRRLQGGFVVRKGIGQKGTKDLTWRSLVHSVKRK